MSTRNRATLVQGPPQRGSGHCPRRLGSPLTLRLLRKRELKGREHPWGPQRAPAPGTGRGGERQGLWGSRLPRPHGARDEQKACRGRTEPPTTSAHSPRRKGGAGPELLVSSGSPEGPSGRRGFGAGRLSPLAGLGHSLLVACLPGNPGRAAAWLGVSCVTLRGGLGLQPASRLCFLCDNRHHSILTLPLAPHLC